MNLTRRHAIGLLAGLTVHKNMGADTNTKKKLDFASGPFQATLAALQTYEIPQWFRDAKFGIWAHWGPQSGVEAGDWYARNMYMEGSPQYKHHVSTYGHPSKIGFKDLVPRWRADQFDPHYLMGLYKKAGAQYFVSMGVHHDNFDLWNSKHNRWNAVQMGPKKDVVGLWAKAAREHGLRFGVSEHLWITYKWFSTSHGADQSGELAGVPYDGHDPKYSDFYTDVKTVYTKLPWNEEGIPEAWRYHWYQRIKDLVDNYQPDLLYTDGALPFEEYGYSVVANLYNVSAQRNGGKADAVYTSKRQEDCVTGTCVLDVERGVVDKIWPRPWQTDTCIGDWHYKRGQQYKSPKTVIDLLCDIVSRNGNLLLNFPLPNSGMLDPQELEVLSGITQWMTVNGEGIYGTRPWKIFGEGPSTQVTGQEAKFNERSRKALTAEDIRFTTKGNVLYAFVMGVPDQKAIVPALALGGPQNIGKIQNVELLGYKGKLAWTQDTTGLRVQLPAEKPSNYALALKVIGV